MSPLHCAIQLDSKIIKNYEIMNIQANLLAVRIFILNDPVSLVAYIRLIVVANTC